MNHCRTIYEIDKLDTLTLGLHLDNSVDTISIDCSAWFRRYPELTDYRIEVQSPEGINYNAVTKMREQILVWTVTDTDTAVPGTGFFQVVATGHNGERKTSDHPLIRIGTILNGSSTEDPPDPSRPWTDKILEAAKSVEESAQSAQESAESAEEDANRAKEIADGMGYYTPSVSNNGDLFWVQSNPEMPNVIPTNIRGPIGYTFTPTVDSEGNISWSNDGSLQNPTTVNIKGPQGIAGVIFTPTVDDTGNLSWSNNGELPNPTTVNVRGSDGRNGVTYTPSLNSEGDLSWTNDGDLQNPPEVNIKGPAGRDGTDGVTYTPSVSDDGTISWTNDGGLENPSSINVRGSDGKNGVTYTPSVSDDGVISWTNDGNLLNPETKNIRGPIGYTFTPSMSSEGDLSWSNNGDLPNPSTVNIRGISGVFVGVEEPTDGYEVWVSPDGEVLEYRGATFTPHVSETGELSWTNDQGLINPPTVNIRGLDGEDGKDGTNGRNGVTYTPSMSADGTLSWTNNGGLDNPDPVNLKGSSGVFVGTSEPTDEDCNVWIDPTSDSSGSN